MPDKDQIFIFNRDEASLLKNTFAGNDTLLYTIRKVLLQLPLTEVERGLIKTAITPELFHVLKKRIRPELSNEFPLQQLSCLLFSQTEQNSLSVKSSEELAPLFAAKQIEMDYIDQQLAKLQDMDAPEPIRLADLGKITADADATHVKLLAYSFLLGYIDPMLNFLRSFAGQKDETPEDQAKRLKRDSSQ